MILEHMKQYPTDFTENMMFCCFLYLFQERSIVTFQ